jgi:hypothetical protein
VASHVDRTFSSKKSEGARNVLAVDCSNCNSERMEALKKFDMAFRPSRYDTGNVMRRLAPPSSDEPALTRPL